MSKPDPDVWMWERARSMLEQADRLQRRFFQLAPPGGKRSTWEPPVDVFETATELWILVALPGVPAERVEVALHGALLVVRGQRPLPEAFRRATVHRLEIPYGRFERRIQLPDGRYEIGPRQLVDGCVVLRFAKLGP